MKKPTIEEESIYTSKPKTTYVHVCIHILLYVCEVTEGGPERPKMVFRSLLNVDCEKKIAKCSIKIKCV